MTIIYKADIDPAQKAKVALEAEEKLRRGQFDDSNYKSDYMKVLRKYSFDEFAEPRTAAEMKESLGLDMDHYGSCVLQTFLRTPYTKHCAWAAPSVEALNTVIKFAAGPIEEQMAGGGYWTYLLRKMGQESVTAYDKGSSAHYEPEAVWVDVLEHDAMNGPVDKTATILLIWPPMESWDPEERKAYFNSMGSEDMAPRPKPLPNSDASAALTAKMVVGQKLVYIGEGYGGCTGTDKFHSILDSYFEEVGGFDVPQWPGLHDRGHLYVKKKDFDLDDVPDEEEE